MNLIAHRGLQTKNTKENTLISLSLGNIHPKIAGIELDVRLTKDNRVVVIHDEYIDRVSNGRGKVSEMSLSRLKSFNYGTNIKHSTINTLDEILDKMDSNGLIVIELKDELDRNDILSSKVLQIIKNYDNLNIWLKSFSLDIIKYLKRYSDRPIGVLINKYNTNLLDLNVDFYSISKNVINKDILRDKFNDNKQVMVWAVNSKNEFDNLYNKIGKFIDDIYIISDNPLKNY